MSTDESKLCTTNGESPAKVRAEQTEETGQHKGYLILCDAERAKGFVKPYRDRYKHQKCGTTTTMGRKIAETYARNPYFYGATFCVSCNAHYPLYQFTWEPDGEPMDPHDPAWLTPTPQGSKLAEALRDAEKAWGAWVPTGPYRMEYVEPMGSDKERAHWRISDASDSRIATCYVEANASFIVRMLNREAANR